MNALMRAREVQGLRESYDRCWEIATHHYENFAVGSWLLPRRLRRHIAAVYAFARTADDLADEGRHDAGDRLARLDSWERQLEDCVADHVTEPIFVALGETIRSFEVPLDPFRSLLHAFRRDAEFQPFTTFAELREYCRCSADPVGRIVLHLFGYRDGERQALADAICTGLQLANFWQDLAVDAGQGRLYVPLEDLDRFGCTRAELRHGILTAPVRRLLAFQVQRARGFLLDGLPLAQRVDRRLAREVRLFAWGGLAVLHRIEEAGYDVFRHRPTLSGRFQATLVLRALLATNGAPVGRPPAGAVVIPTRGEV